MKRSNIMKRLQGLGLLGIQSGVELLLFFPILLLLYRFLSPVALAVWLLFLWLSYTLGGLLVWFRIRLTWLLYSIIVLVSGVLTVMLYGGQLHASVILVWLLSAMLLYRGVRMSAVAWSGDVPAILCIIGLGSYFAVSFIASLSEAWRGYLPILLWTGLISLSVCLFLANRTHIRMVSPAGVSKVSSILSKNRIWIVLLVGVILFISFFQVINQALMAIVYGTSYLIKWLGSLLNSGEIPPLQDSEQNEVLIPEPAEDPSIWSKILNYLFYGFFSMVILFIAGIFLVWIFKNFRSVWKRIINWFRHLLLRENKWISDDGYIDEKKHLIQWKEIRSSFGKRFKQRFARWFQREARWSSLTDWRARVRWLYRRKLLQAIRQGYNYQPHLTPRQTLSTLADSGDIPDLAPIHPLLARYYEQARYGSPHEIVSDDEVEKIKQDIKVD